MQGLHLCNSLHKGICSSLSKSTWKVTLGFAYTSAEILAALHFQCSFKDTREILLLNDAVISFQITNNC